MALETRVHEGPDAFEIPEWRDLLKRDPQRHVFHTPEWHRLWWEEFGEGKDLLVLEMHEGDRTVALVPLYRKRDEGRAILRFVGGIDLTDYLGPICSEEDRHVVADALMSWLADAPDWDEFDAHNMPVPFGFAEFLAESADRQGLHFSLDQEETAAILRLPGDWESYLASLDSKERHELKRKRRRLAREHPDVVVRSSTAETLDQDLKVFVDMHRGTDGHKGHFMKPEIATFFERVARAFMPLGWLRLDFLEIGGSALATTFGFEVENTIYLYNSAYEPEARRLSPGLILVSELIEDAIDRKVEVFDFMRGPERYKYQLGSEAVPLNNVQVFRSQA
jgi:CelD/BcsL family acetyltransferase involved in cellulose biosynthesis